MPTTLPAAALVTAWSAPVNGLAVRVEQVAPAFPAYPFATTAVYVRVRNAGDRPMVVPVAGVGAAGSPFRLMVASAGVWHPLATDENRAQPVSTCRLGPGDEAVCRLGPVDAAGLNDGEAFRVAVSVASSDDPAAWIGAVEAPARRTWIDPSVSPPLLDAPHVFPSFVEDNWPGMNASVSDVPHAGRLWAHNVDWMEQLRAYPPAAVRADLERQLATCPAGEHRLFLAAVASTLGSSAGRDVLAAARDDLGMTAVVGRLDLLTRLAEPEAAPAWVWDELRRAFADRRMTTADRHQPPDRLESVAAVAWDDTFDVVDHLGWSRSPEAVPFLESLGDTPDHKNLALSAMARPATGGSKAG